MLVVIQKNSEQFGFLENMIIVTDDPIDKVKSNTNTNTNTNTSSNIDDDDKSSNMVTHDNI